MRTILLPILSAIFSLTTLLSVERASASLKNTPQTNINICGDRHNYSTFNVCYQNPNSLTPQKWRRLLEKYYRTRYRTQFEKN